MKAIAAGLAFAAFLEPGISDTLARSRAQDISALSYDLSFDIPESRRKPILGRETIRFVWKGSPRPLVIDFRQPPGTALEVRSKGARVRHDIAADHIVVPAAAIAAGRNELELLFTAGDGPLNRADRFLYTLLVPARAHEAFPCFDQPDLKARYTLSLKIPEAWEALANGAEASRETRNGRNTLRFAQTQPISTYLFAFAAGEFKIETAERQGRRLRMFHRETDAKKVARNRDAVFDLTAQSLSEMERYTGIPYPFEKFDFFLAPSFQYSGMEHPGAVWLDATDVLLEESATQQEMLSRADVIAHETAHMWFGDLVTMRWFNDVWLKEVFAGFMAAKMVNPSFPGINHDLLFLMQRYPAAYKVDRAAGANPILQPLENLADAGSLYGPIIYKKAPIVMKHLELLMGATAFQEGLREYLRAYKFGNAAWDDLVAILSRHAAGLDLRSWSRTWVEQAGRPTITTSLALTQDRRIASLRLEQKDSRGRGLLWEQPLRTTLYYSDSNRQFPVLLGAASVRIDAARGLPAPDFIVADASGAAYGLFEFDPASRRYLLEHLPDVKDPLVRAIAWTGLWDSLLEKQTPPDALLAAAMAALSTENNELIVQRVLYDAGAIYWRFISPARRRVLAEKLEALLWDLLRRAPEKTMKAAYFNAYRSIALTPEAARRLEKLWRKQLDIPGLPLSEEDMTNLAFGLALRDVPDAEKILDGQLERIANPDRKERFRFIAPALSRDPRVRDAFFAGLADPENRRHEAWVEAALKYLHHPLRAASSEKYILPSLELLAEIRRTGDIFFPKSWLDGTLSGHNSADSAAIVRRFLKDRPQLDPRLRDIILQSADELFRSSIVVYSE